jgi:hypothetical protein
VCQSWLRGTMLFRVPRFRGGLAYPGLTEPLRNPVPSGKADRVRLAPSRCRQTHDNSQSPSNPVADDRDARPGSHVANHAAGILGSRDGRAPSRGEPGYKEFFTSLLVVATLDAKT